ncbi:MAG: hypothetical protein HC814_00715, partial [Rhodobacteraceae bacterium]|nr:hypothetical protein [Paracoccaceae bacterium]
TSHYGTGGTHDGNLIATAVRSVSAIDATSGYVTDETAVVTEIAGGASAGASSRLRSVQTGVLNDVSNWCLGRSRGAQVTASHTLAGGAAITRSFSQEWDGPKCRPTERRIEPGDSQWQVIYRLAYDTFGNPAAIGIEGAGTTARTTAIDWGSRGQLPIRIVDPLAQATQLSWDHGHGLLLAMTDPNALTMRWSYRRFRLP